jgi:hypothetical protein
MALLTLCTAMPAWAKRPYDGTDADTVPPQDLEVALGLGTLKERGEATVLTAPVAGLTYGLRPGWELAFQAAHERGLGSGGGSAFVDGEIGTKFLLREGALQAGSGASIAGELLVLLPDSGGGSDPGISWATVVSFKTQPFDLHLNGSIALTREGTAEAAGSLILEFLPDQAVHPVAEISYRHEFNQSHGASALAGVLWDLREDFSLDLAVRRSWSGERETELRLGLTFLMP